MLTRLHTPDELLCIVSLRLSAFCLAVSEKKVRRTMYRTRSKAWKGLVIKLIQAAICFVASKQPETVTFEKTLLLDSSGTLYSYSEKLSSNSRRLDKVVESGASRVEKW